MYQKKKNRMVALEAHARAITNVISIEDDVTTAYKVIRSTVKTSQSPFNELQTLRLNYPGYVPPGTYAWFGKALEAYSPSVITLVAMMEEHRIPATKLASKIESRNHAHFADGKPDDHMSIEEKKSEEDPFEETAVMIDISARRHLVVPNPVSDALLQLRRCLSLAQWSEARKIYIQKVSVRARVCPVLHYNPL